VHCHLVDSCTTHFQYLLLSVGKYVSGEGIAAMCTAARYLLIVACSQRKCVTPGVLPALERYDGVYFRVLRKARREGYWPAKLDVLIVSAKYGLLEANTPITHYDVRMTREQATRLRPLVVPPLAEWIASRTYTEIFLNMGKTYHMALDGWDVSLTRDITVLYAKGGIGQKASQMRTWLLEKIGDRA
jgi:hypothetical protein